MRRCINRVPRLRRVWRLAAELREDSLWAIWEPEEELSGDEEVEDSETEDELSFLDTDEESVVCEEESEDSESEEDKDWYGLIEV